MRLILASILLLSLPVLVIAHLQYYSTSLQDPLFLKVSTALEAPEFAQVKISLDYMDVTLKGSVADLATREKARKLVDDMRGLRCREEDNFIQVSARLDGTLANGKLLLAGWLHDEATLRDTARWLASARPEIEVVTGAVRVSPHVTIEEAPGEGGVPAAFRPAWEAIEVPSSLNVQREGAQLTVSGHLRNASLKDEVVSAVTTAAGPASLDTGQLAAGPYVRDAKFASELLPAFLRTFFDTPGAAWFKAEEGVIQLSADATPTMQHDWLEMLEPMTRDADLQAQVRVFPSVFHFPERATESQAPEEPLAVLRDTLRAAAIPFEPGSATPAAGEQPKLAAVAAAIITAGPDVRIIVGGYGDPDGNPEDNAVVARRRAENVVASLVGKGVAPRMLEATVFETVPGEIGRSRQVELLIK